MVSTISLSFAKLLGERLVGNDPPEVDYNYTRNRPLKYYAYK